MRTDAAPIEKQRSIRKTHLYAAVAVWGTMLGSVGLYLLFGWLNVWRPHIAWWWLTAGLVVLSVTASFLLTIRQLFGRDCIRCIGVFMISVVPLVWLASFLWSTINVIDAREDLKMTAPIRSLGLWVGSYFELEARWRYPRVTEGQHVMLFDSGETPNVETMVAEMDKHIEQMAATLETSIPKVKARWVRGSLFGQHGRAIGAWAICDTKDDIDKLEYLDFHEVAHVTLTTMCPVAQEMPMLLCEGWAQSQSMSMPDAIVGLCEAKQSDDFVSLNEIVTKGYGRSTGPAYQYGGPLATYLIERFGGAKFVELYGSVRRESFPDDVQRVTGVAWGQLEEDFWAWIENGREEAKKTLMNSAEDSIFSFDRESDKRLWQEILASTRQVNASIELPDDVAVIEKETSDSWNSETKYVFEGDCMWKVTNRKTDPPITQFQIATADECGYFVRKGNKVTGDNSWHASSYKEEIANAKSAIFGYNRLARLLMIDLVEMKAAAAAKIQIHSIQPQAETPFWKFTFTSSYGAGPENTQQIEALLDPIHHFDVREMTTHQNGKKTVHKLETDKLQGTPIVTRWSMARDRDENFTRTITALSSEEAAKVKEDVQAASATAEEPDVPVPVADEKNWQDALVSPPSLAIGWPVLGLAFLLIDFLCDRIRFKAN